MILECRQIDYTYPGTGKPVLRDMSLALEEPGFHALFGPSGVGKTSLARILTGGITPSSGQIRYNGLETRFYAYNMERLPGWSSVGRHLERITPSHRKARKGDLIDAFGLSDILDQRFGQLSLGQQNRVNLLRYLVQDFDLLIMDESLANVDEKTRGQILLAIKAFFPDAVFVYISHNVVEVATYCRCIWVLRDPEKAPQAVALEGLDSLTENAVDHPELQRAMLEIVNAA